MSDDTAFGVLLDVEELSDGRLQVAGVRADPAIRSVGGLLFPEGFDSSDEFVRLGEHIMEAGGYWELFAHGVFSAYVPRNAPLDIRQELNGAVRG